MFKPLKSRGIERNRRSRVRDRRRFDRMRQRWLHQQRVLASCLDRLYEREIVNGQPLIVMLC